MDVILNELETLHTNEDDIEHAEHNEIEVIFQNLDIDRGDIEQALNELDTIRDDIE